MANTHFEPQSIAKNGLDAISGILYLEFNNFIFPEPNWNDQVIAVLNGWLSQLDALRLNASSEARLFFMEGPFVVIISHDGDSPTYNVACVCKSDPARPEWVGVCILDDLLCSVCQAARQALDACTKNGWLTRDIQTMAVLLSEISSREL